MPDIFISYSRADQPIARLYAEAFARAGFDVWWDQTLASGEAYDEVTENALRSAGAVVVLWSKTSSVSRWVRAEATVADRNRTLVPATIEPCERPIMFELTQTADLSHWRGAPDDPAFLAFIADLRRRLAARAPTPAPPPVVADGRPAILVLPFLNIGGEPEHEAFSDGVSEDIITDLGRISGLAVVARHAAFALKGKTVAAADLARDFGATHLLEGSVRRAGERVRVTAQLADAKTDKTLWAERYDRRLDDIFAIQDEISRAIADALKVRLAPEEARAIGKRPTTNTEAYELYLIARRFLRTGSERMQPLVVRICERVTELDPDFAAAFATMAFAEGDMIQRGHLSQRGDGGREAARRAVALNPDLAEAHAAVGEIFVRIDLDFAAARPHVERALAIDPDCYEANLLMGYIETGGRRYAEAARAFEKAAALDPGAFRPLGMAVQCYEGLGDAAGAASAARRTLERCERILAVEPDHGGAIGFYVNTLADLGQAERARIWAERAVLFDPGNERLSYNLACAMAGLGDAGAAVRYIERILDRMNVGFIEWMEKDNSLDPVRADPGFAALMERARARARELGRATAASGP